MKKLSLITILILGSLLFLFQCTKEGIDPDPLSIILSAIDVTTFGGQDGSVMATVEGGIAPYEYFWSNGATTKDIGGLSAGLYSVEVKDVLDSIICDSIIVNQPLPDSTVTDIDENIYNIVEIGEQTWMQENLRVTKDPDGSEIENYVYNNNMEYVNSYGRLYTWDVAMNGTTDEGAQGICPCGWHIPSDDEWKTLEMYLGMTQDEADLSNTWRGTNVGTKLKAGGESGYEALLSGRRTSSGSFQLLNSYEYIWTSTESGGNNAWRRCLRSSSNIGRWNTFQKTYAFSVRCVKDKE